MVVHWAAVETMTLAICIISPFAPSCVARQISSFTLGKCWPVQHATASWRRAVRCLTTDRSCMPTRPEDALPVTLVEDGGWFMPWL
jgi:hypothetical protein